MVNYETLMLARTEITDDEIGTIERQFDKIIAAQKGRITVFDKWGKYKLAYPVEKGMYGVYILARYEVSKDGLQKLFSELDALFKIKYNELIMRHVTIKLPEDTTSVYKYPQSIGYHGTSNLDSFIKENKMEGLIDMPVKKEDVSQPDKEEAGKEVENTQVEGK